MDDHEHSWRSEQGYECPDCEELFSAWGVECEEPLYECWECGSIFSRGGSLNGDSNQCPDCFRFAARVWEGSAIACPSCEQACLDEVEVEHCPTCDEVRLPETEATAAA